MPDRMPDTMSEYNMPERMSGRMSGYIYIYTLMPYILRGWGSLKVKYFLLTRFPQTHPANPYFLLGCASHFE